MLFSYFNRTIYEPKTHKLPWIKRKCHAWSELGSMYFQFKKGKKPPYLRLRCFTGTSFFFHLIYNKKRASKIGERICPETAAEKIHDDANNFCIFKDGLFLRFP